MCRSNVKASSSPSSDRNPPAVSRRDRPCKGAIEKRLVTGPMPRYGLPCGSELQGSDEEALQNDEQEQKNSPAYHDPRPVQRAVEIDQRRDQTEDHAAEQSARDEPDAAGEQSPAQDDRGDRGEFGSGAGERVARRGI